MSTVHRLPPVVPAHPVEKPFKVDLAPGSPFDWLRDGWKDMKQDPGSSLFYGFLVFVVSALIVVGLIYLQWDYILFPITAGFLVLAPVLAVGLYRKSRALEHGEHLSLGEMLSPIHASNGQLFFTGAMLLMLMLTWMRAAVIVYGIFFGVRPFPGISHVAEVLFTTPTGITMLVIGTLIGGLFAAFSFAISAFSIPMILDKSVDSMTAMGTSWALVVHNLPRMLVWGAIILVLFLLSVATGFVALIIVYPLLGHATWHAYRSVRHSVQYK